MPSYPRIIPGMTDLGSCLPDICKSRQETGGKRPAATSESWHAGFDDQQWYQQLYDYGMSASFGPGDADEELIPRLVKELVLPLAHHALANVWNTTSRRQSKAAAAMLADLLVYVPPDDSNMQVGHPCMVGVCINAGGVTSSGTVTVLTRRC